jgi:hypothetical protein
MTVSRIAAIGFAIALGSLSFTQARAAQVFHWTFTDSANVIEGSGLLTTGAANNGGFDIVALSGFLNDPTVGVNGPVTGFTPGSGNDGVFAWDNIVYTTPGQAHLDNLGLLFQTSGQEINIYNSVGGCCSVVYPGAYPLGDVTAGSDNNYGGDRGTFNISAAPEPATWAMMLVGFGSLGALLRSRRKQVGAAATA